MSDVEPSDDVVHDGIDDEIDGEVDGEVDGNRLVAAVPRNVLEYLAKSVVEDPEAVVVDADERGGRSGSFQLQVAPSDMGRVIGRRGRVVQAMRAVVRAAGAREGVEARVDVVE